MNSMNANPRGRPVSRSTGSTTCDGGATPPKYVRRSDSVVLYDRLPTNRRTANQFSPNVEEGRREPRGGSRNTRWQPIQSQKPYLNRCVRASGREHRQNGALAAVPAARRRLMRPRENPDYSPPAPPRGRGRRYVSS